MSLTIASVNVNGIRAACKQRNENNPGMNAWLEETSADIVLMQEVRATPQQAEKALAPALGRGAGTDTPHGKRGEATTSPQSPTGQRHAGRNWLIPRPDNSDSIGHRQIDNVGDVAHSCSR